MFVPCGAEMSTPSCGRKRCRIGSHRDWAKPLVIVPFTGSTTPMAAVLMPLGFANRAFRAISVGPRFTLAVTAASCSAESARSCADCRLSLSVSTRRWTSASCDALAFTCIASSNDHPEYATNATRAVPMKARSWRVWT